MHNALCTSRALTEYTKKGAILSGQGIPAYEMKYRITLQKKWSFPLRIFSFFFVVLNPLLDNQRKGNIYKTSRTSSQCLINVQFTPCVEGELLLLNFFLRNFNLGALKNRSEVITFTIFVSYLHVELLIFTVTSLID